MNRNYLRKIKNCNIKINYFYKRLKIINNKNNKMKNQNKRNKRNQLNQRSRWSIRNRR